MPHVLAFVLAALAVVVIVQLVSDRTGAPAAALLTLSGLVYAVLPGPNIELDPDVILTFVIPPLLYSAALGSSLLAIRQNLRIVLSLSVGLVLTTAVLVGIGIHAVVPSIGLAAAIALGGAVAPPDPVAALAVGRRAKLPARLVTLIEGEGLLNDATALTTLTVAVAAASSGSFSLGGSALQFVVAAAGGLVAGFAVAVAVRWLRHFVHDPLLVNSISLATPFAAYLLGAELHVSGVLAVVVAGLVIGHGNSLSTSGASRLQTTAVWRLVDFLLQGFVFLLIGQQLPTVVRGLDAYETSTVVLAASVTVGVVLLIRPLWMLLIGVLPGALHLRLGGDPDRGERRLTGREVFVLSWSGTRGVITLAAVFTLPLVTDTGAPFPGRNLLLFCAFVVVLVTLVGQGVTFVSVVRAVGLKADDTDVILIRNQARAASVQAALHVLDELGETEEIDEDVIAAYRSDLSRRARRYSRRVDLLEGAEDGELPVSPGYEAALQLRRTIIDTQREELLRWRDSGRLPDSSLRLLERELDHQETTLPRR